MTTTLITGANKGLGFETARRLIAAGHTVYAGSRDAERGHRAAGRLGARMVLIDVTADASVAGAAKTIEADGGLDVLVNNAGIEMRTEGNVVPGAAEITARLMRSLFETNVFGVVRVTHAFLPLLRRSAAPVVVNVSSGLASMTRLTTPGTPAYAYPGVAYPASKAAVNMITVQYAKAFPDMRINAVEPGYTATDLNGNMGTQTVEEGAEIIVRMAQVGPDGPTGGYVGAPGPLPWEEGRKPAPSVRVTPAPRGAAGGGHAVPGAPAVARQSRGCRRRPGSTICEPWTISTSVAHCRCGKGPAHRVRPRRGSSYSNTAGFTCGTCTGSSRSGAEAHGQMAVGAQPAGRTEPSHQSGSCRS